MSILMILVILILMQLSCVYPQHGWHMMDWNHMDYGYGGIIMWIIFLIIIGVIIYFIINRGKFIKREEDETALEIIKKRYARGEITKEEYERMKKDLEG